MLKPVFTTLALGASLCFADEHAIVLQYHHVSNDTPASTSVSPERFEQHLNWLADNGYHVMPLSEIVRLLQERKPLPERSVAITLDDGYSNNYSEAYPRL